MKIFKRNEVQHVGLVKKKKRVTAKDLQIFSLWIIPALLVFVFSYIPMFGIVIAFKDYRLAKGIFGSDWNGFKNFELFLKSKDFTRITWNTLSLNVLFIILTMSAAVIVAILLYEVKKKRATKLYQSVLITPYFISWVVAAYMVFALLNTERGVINLFLEKLGFEKIDWYTTPGAWPAILAIASVWKSVGMDSVIYYASMMSIDQSLYEAAALDGASKFQQARYITLPSILPLIVMMGILKVGGILSSDFGLFYQLTRDVGVLYSTTDVIDTYIFRTMRVYGNMGLSAAVGLLKSVVGIILVVTTNYLSKKVDKDYGLF